MCVCRLLEEDDADSQDDQVADLFQSVTRSTWAFSLITKSTRINSRPCFAGSTDELFGKFLARCDLPHNIL